MRALAELSLLRFSARAASKGRFTPLPRPGSVRPLPTARRRAPAREEGKSCRIRTAPAAPPPGGGGDGPFTVKAAASNVAVKLGEADGVVTLGSKNVA